MKALFAWISLLFSASSLTADEAEIKMLIDDKHFALAIEKLQLNADKKPETHVCFFDTTAADLDAHDVIIRVRQELNAKPGQAREMDSVVKLRGDTAPPEPFDKVKPEADWVGPKAEDVRSTYAIKEKVTLAPKEADVTAVLDGSLNVSAILTQAQKDFALACLGAETLPNLKRYGVIQAWKAKRPLGPFNEVTVEFWRLTRAGKEPRDLLELSIRTKAADASAAAAEFYTAASAKGLGKPTGKTKTQEVIDYYQPGV